jgi:hypothetical protein
MLYYTQFIGDANNLPVILGLPNFYGIALLDSDPYLAYGYSWWANQVCQPTLHVTSMVLIDDAIEQHVAASPQFCSRHSTDSPWCDSLLALASRSRSIVAKYRVRDDRR